MITCITVGHPHLGVKDAKPEVILGPDKLSEDHIANFKKLCGSRSHPKFGLVQVLASNAGSIRSQSFITPKEAELREAGREAKKKAVLAQGNEKPGSDAKSKADAEAHKAALAAKERAKAVAAAAPERRKK